MTWVEKMEYVLGKVFYAGLTADEYKVYITSDKSFEILKNGNEILSRESVNNTESHWRHEITECIKIMMDNKIQKALSEI